MRQNRKKIYEELKKFGSWSHDIQWSYRGYYLCAAGMNCMRSTGRYNYANKLYPASIRIRKTNKKVGEFQDIYMSLDHDMTPTEIEQRIKKEIDIVLSSR